ncbi:MAG TPA: alpha/beta hydrolase [Bacteroidales bacterium]|mgnify:CR=1 FL=1|nr:alpha/beta hydrolase [Bacteroidales bacterium]
MRYFLITLLLTFTAGAFSQGTVGTAPGSPAVVIGDNPSAGRFVKIRGISLYYESYGSGRPLLLIHGNGGSIASMAGQVPFFSATYRVIAADSRAQGKSADPSDSLSYEMMADDMNALLEALHLDSACVIGWSDGGITGLLLAIRHPEKVRKLAVTGANIRPDTSAVTLADIQGMIAEVKQMRAEKPSPEIKNRIKLTQMMIDQPTITRRQLQTIQCPVLVIGGDHDIIKPAHTLEIFQSLRKGSLWILPDSGHGTLIEHREDFNVQVNRFFKK